MGRSEPAIIVPEGSKGELVAKSTITPVFLPAPCHVTLAPDAMHSTAPFGKSGIFDLTAAEEPPEARLTSRTHADPFAPHVFLAVHSVSGCGFEQIDGLVLLALAPM